MEKKTILVLTGSPRKGGNSDMMAEAFIEGATSVGHEVLRFDAGRNTVNGCRACGACWAKGSACVFEDGFTELAQLLVKADVLVFSTPLYWFNFPSQLKAAIDKMNAFLKPNCPTPLKIRESVLMVCAHDTDDDLFDG
ncbi:MAG TPA: flavodoxin family protein, partial [Synergistales bacterium]|nr:flavodoxin family protein [Synergistales bacterium]